MNELTPEALEPKWDEPLPLGWPTDLPEFPVDALPPVIADYTKAIAAELQTPLGLVGPVALGMLSAAIGGRVRIWVRSGWEEPSNLYIVPVADPASRKSAVVAECRQPLDVAETELRDLLAGAVADSTTEREVLEQFAEKAKKKAGQSGKAEDIAEAQAAVRAAQAVEVIAYPRLTTADATPEAIVGALAEQGGRITAISAEAGLFDTITGRYSSKPNLDPILMAHAGDTIIVDRRSRAPERIDRPALTMVVSIQPFALREMIDREDFAGRGLLARVLWSLPQDLAGSRPWEVPAAPEYVKRAYRALIADLAVTIGMSKETVTLTLTEQAYKVLGEYYLEVEAMLRHGSKLGDGLLKFWGGKLVGAAVRIAGCLHAAGGPDALARHIDESTLRGAIEIAEYFRHHAMAALTPAEDKRTIAARKVMRVLVDKNMRTFTARELHRRLPRALQSAEAIASALTYLENLGYVQPRPGKGWELHPNAENYLTPADTADSADNRGPTAGQRPAVSVSTPADTADNNDPTVSTVSTTADNLRKPATSTGTRAVSAVSTVSTPPCSTCGKPLDRSLADAGETTHPTC